MTLPCCGTCIFALPSDNGADAFCHAQPPNLQRTQVIVKGPDGKPVSEERVGNLYTPVGIEKTGCGLHQDWPKPRPLRSWWRGWTWRSK